MRNVPAAVADSLWGTETGGTPEQKAVISAEVRPLNPIVPEGVYIADPEVRQMPDGRIYVYGSKDEPGTAWCSPRYNVLSSSDLVNWDMEQDFLCDSRHG